MLIDFDCALRIDDTTDHEARSEMTGTFPFMSVNNLEASKVIRTELDDWESIIYVLCWLGTFGVNADDEEEHKRPDNDFDSLNIEKWRIGTDKAVANAKRNHMHSHDNFAFAAIPEQSKKEPCWDGGCDEDELDQFKRRATCAGEISDALLEAIKDAREGACERIAPSVEVAA
ncbi:hypothetical protein LPJ74_006799, partial [Coemansia sp. RSA 1843]